MAQQDLGLSLSTRRTRRQVLLDEVKLVMSWAELVALIAMYAPVAKTGRPPFAIEMTLRIRCLQQWLGLFDLAAEEALFEMVIYRNLVGLSGIHRIPDRVSILRFRHLLEVNGLSPCILQMCKSWASVHAHGP